ncbi:ComE operon protein 1 [Pseudoalteromonas sp. P1-16-1b]|jgi:competence protein ComEA|uniref:ComEA family DNA-binding protein n=1 Tax=unclassified Pseudoalteromonas TaxID=194690 RepID=UPI0006D66640|nr:MULTISPECIES: ComEA family DNA-binding protein [unclassified Pseudoalteromonas]OLF76191.1 competence protein [Pseudoalteromonas haloplanktis]KPZ64061.1 ComE operon protein 1 [Pseudoalteromonas sp. P1-16-1b]MCK8128113.1 ComEA family DNA-binding protein [Pseudoalteromonas sp. 2CM39R]PWS55712.1 ComEA family DNA-binding protein [Pseudoalteromonas sp. meg-B1]TMP55237.1 competence protein [Pseudoalteromonas sp. S1612]
MKLIKIISLAAALCLLPMGTTFAQSDMLSEQMQSAMVNINTADLKQLIKLPGVGKKKAQAIIDYREANGDFASLEDLAKVKGVGKKMLAKLDGKVTF